MNSCEEENDLQIQFSTLSEKNTHILSSNHYVQMNDENQSLNYEKSSYISSKESKDIKTKNSYNFNEINSWPLKSLNDENILTVLNNKLQKGENFKSVLINFLQYFTKNFLKIGNISLFNQKTHQSGVKSVDFSYDDLYFCSAGSDGVIKIYETKNQKEISKFNQNDKILCCRFSPIDYQIIVGSKNKSLTLYDFEKEIWQIQAHQDKINCVDFNKSKTMIVSGSDDNYIKLWDMEGNLIHNFTGHRDAIKSVNFWKNGEKIISGSHDRFFRIWSIPNKVCEFKFKGSQDGISDAIVSKDLELLAFTDIKQIKLWCPSRFKELTSLIGHENLVRSLSINQECDRLCSASEDNQIRIWNLQTRQCEAILTGEIGSLYGFRCARFSNKGDLILSGSYDGNVRLWESNSSRSQKVLKISQVMTTYEDEILSAKFSQDSRYIVSGSEDSKIRVSDLNGAILKEISNHDVKQFNQHPVTCIRFSPCNNYFCTGSEDKTCIIWNCQNFEPVFQLISHRHNISSIAYSKDGERIASGSIDKTIKIWDTSNGKLIQTLYGHDEGVSFVYYLIDLPILLSCSYDKTIKIWETQEYRLQQTLKGHEDRVNQVIYGNNQIFSCSNDKTVRVWSYELLSCTNILKGHHDRVLCLAYSETEKLLCSAGDDKTIRCWNVENMICQAIVYDHKASILSLDFDSQGKELVSGDEDGNLIIRSSNDLQSFSYLMSLVLELQKSDMLEFQEDYQQQQNLNLYLELVRPSLINTLLPLKMTILHYALYMNDIKLLQKVLNFSLEHEIYIQPTLDAYGQSPFHLAQGNRDAMTHLVHYYGDPSFVQEYGINQSSSIFVEFLPLLIKERIPGIIQFLDSRIKNAYGNHPKVGEYFDGIKCYSSLTPSLPQFQTQAKIVNKCNLQFQVLDTPDILQINHPFLKALVSLPQTSGLYSTQFIDYYLKFKWNNFGKKQFYKDLLYFCFYLSIYFFELLYLYPQQQAKLNALRITVHLFLLWSKGLFRIMVVSTLICDWIQLQGIPSRWLRAIGGAMGLLKLLSKFRGFEKIGFALRILIQVLKDIRYVCVIITAFIAMFTTIGYVLQDMNAQTQNHYTIFKYVFRILMYDFNSIFMNSTEKSSLYIAMQLFFFVSTFILTIILTELMIAFMCDTFDRVLGEEKSAKNYEFAQLLYQYEQKMRINQDPNLKYLLIVSCFSDQQELYYNSIRHRLQKLEQQILEKNNNFQVSNDLQNNLDHINSLDFKVGKRLRQIGQEVQWQETTIEEFQLDELENNNIILKNKIDQLKKLVQIQ